jgi:hypothetical protein
MTAATLNRPTLSPAIAAQIADLAQPPMQLRRAGYVSRLVAMDWQHQHSDSHAAVVAGRMELQALKALRDELDPDHALWKRHAPEWAWADVPVHTLRDFAGDCPVTVEWYSTQHGPRVMAVVVEFTHEAATDFKRIDSALSPEVMQRLNQLVWASAKNKAVL